MADSGSESADVATAKVAAESLPAANEAPVGTTATAGPGTRAIAGIVALVLLLAFATGAYYFRLRTVPDGYFQDSGAVLVNAECIAKVGADEYGTRYPVIFFRSFNDSKAPAFTYLISVFARFGDITPFAMRVVSTTAGFAAVALLLLFAYWKRLVPRPEHVWLMGVAFCLFVLSPWILVLHRFPSEVTLVDLFMVGNLASAFGMLTTGRVRYAIANGLLVGLGAYVYHSLKLMLILHPLLIGAALVQAWRRGTPNPIVSGLTSIGIAELVSWPLLQDILTGGSSLARFRGGGGFNDSWLTRLSRYFSHLDMNFLFVTGDGNLRHHHGFMGELAIGILPFLLWGAALAWGLARSGKPFWTYVILMALFGLTPATLIAGVPHSLRSNAATMPILLIALLGIMEFDKYVDSFLSGARRWPAIAGVAGFAAVSAATLVYSLHYYFGESYATASKGAWYPLHDVDRDMTQGNTHVSTGDHGTGSVFLRSANVEAGHLEYCGQPK